MATSVHSPPGEVDYGSGTATEGVTNRVPLGGINASESQQFAPRFSLAWVVPRFGNMMHAKAVMWLFNRR